MEAPAPMDVDNEELSGSEPAPASDTEMPDRDPPAAEEAAEPAGDPPAPAPAPSAPAPAPAASEPAPAPAKKPDPLANPPLPPPEPERTLRITKGYPDPGSAGLGFTPAGADNPVERAGQMQADPSVGEQVRARLGVYRCLLWGAYGTQVAAGSEVRFPAPRENQDTQDNIRGGGCLREVGGQEGRPLVRRGRTAVHPGGSHRT